MSSKYYWNQEKIINEHYLFGKKLVNLFEPVKAPHGRADSVQPTVL